MIFSYIPCTFCSRVGKKQLLIATIKLHFGATHHSTLWTLKYSAKCTFQPNRTHKAPDSPSTLFRNIWVCIQSGYSLLTHSIQTCMMGSTQTRVDEVTVTTRGTKTPILSPPPFCFEKLTGGGTGRV